MIIQEPTASLKEKRVSFAGAPSLPADFSLACYRFTLKALETLQLPRFKSSALRGGFGHTFKNVVCTQPRLCHQKCQHGNQCPYGYIFETLIPGTNQAAPRPFIIRSADDRRSRIYPGEQLIFELVLIGHGQRFLPYFIAFFRALGERGLGRNRGRYQLVRVEAVSPLQHNSQPVYQAETELIQMPNLVTTGEDITRYAAGLPSDRITLEFVTPTQIKHEEAIIDAGPPFQVLVKTLRRRLSLLYQTHCGQELIDGFQELVESADRVRIVRCSHSWEGWSRISGRQKQEIKMGGLIGQVTYMGPLRNFLPLLALGELIHVGKKTVFGNGQYRIVGNKEAGNGKT